MTPAARAVVWTSVGAGSALTAYCLITAPVWVSAVVVGVEATAWCWWLDRDGSRRVSLLVMSAVQQSVLSSRSLSR